MKKFIQLHIEWILTGVAVLLVALTGWFLVGGVATLAQIFGASLGNPPPAATGQTFDLSGASKLNFRGLQGQ